MSDCLPVISYNTEVGFPFRVRWPQSVDAYQMFNMIVRAQTIIIIVAINIAPAIATTGLFAECNQSCGQLELQFPFGFSSGCPIQLNCSANGTAMVGEFPVQTVTSQTMLLKIPAKCGRSIETLDSLFRANYAPTWRNGILLQNCSSPVTGCLIPSTEVQTNFDMSDCNMKTSNKSNNISCLSGEKRVSDFIGYHDLMSRGCQSLFSAISTTSPDNSTAVMLDVQVIELGWWLEGGCSCSDNAMCTVVSPPDIEGEGHQCQCSQGFVGDGFRAGGGCRNPSSPCSHSDYKAGLCGHSHTTRVRLLVGGVAAGVCLVMCVGLLCCFLQRRYKSKYTERITRRLSIATGIISIAVYPYSLIEKATNSFSEKQQLGKGAYGTVYAGKLDDDDEWVAIKRIKYRGIESIEQVMNEIKLLSSVSHPNLVRLLGCCIENDEQILIYEFMPNGTLFHHLHTEGSDDEGLKWPVRLKIATETAQAVAFLHSDMNPPIYHRDIKSTNILLDCEFKSKVADFGLSRLGLTEASHISTAPQGTPGYLDPQYHQNCYLSDKSDVYSFGVVLVEIITGLKAVDFTRSPNEINLASLAKDRIAKGRFAEIIDPVLDSQTDQWTNLTIHKVVELAFRCLAYESGMRPAMMEVAHELEQIGRSKLGFSNDNGLDSSQASSSCSSSSTVSEIILSFPVSA